MATFRTTCPHCRTRRMGFKVFAVRADPATRFGGFAFGACGHCGWPVTARLMLNPSYKNPNGAANPREFTPQAVSDHPGDIDGPVNILGFWPALAEIEAPGGLTDDVELDFIEAKTNVLEGRYKSGASGLRDVLEAALKTLPEVSGRMSLFDRIDALASKGRLTKELKEWAHAVRLLGNESTHESRPTKEQAEELLHFVEMLFQYLFTLPKMVEQLRSNGSKG